MSSRAQEVIPSRTARTKDRALIGSERREFSARLADLFGISVFLLGVVVFFSVTTNDFLTYNNLVVILANVMVIGIVAMGQLFCIVSGTFDLSVGGVVPLG